MANKDKVETVTVPPEAAGRRLDRFLAEALGDISRSRLKALIAEGRVAAADGTPLTQPSAKVAAGTHIAVTVPAPLPATPQGQDIPLDILYEDAALIVIDKPAGLVVHPAPGNPDRTLVNALIGHCGDGLTGIGGEKRPGIVHRLDKETSGVMVAAKTAAALQSLTEQFAERSVDRAYRAIAWGAPTPARGEIEGAIGRNPRNRKKMAVVKRGGKPALTRYAIAQRFPASGAAIASLLECRLATGRTHQIRVHLAHIGHPIIGDPAYGRAPRKHAARAGTPLPDAAKTAISLFPRQALHAYRLGFTHPLSGERLDFETKLPHDMAELLNVLELI